ncbi:Sodium- and chloride-dependent GABA transporter ine [Lamellibrachia satsuma]|nr:Sodium- and chloride-dependent GABA transporter ine [Lamellibrachia satsuma]
MSTTRPNESVAPSQEFFENQVLKQSPCIEDTGNIVWPLAFFLLVSWILVYLSLWKGIRLTGKIVYFTATFPYVVIFLMLIRGVTLPGSKRGIDFFIYPQWHLLRQPKTWINAAMQNFNSVGIAFGSMMTFASYNRRDSNIFRSVLAITLVNSATSIIAGFAVFSILGHIALNQGQEVKDVVTEGPGLVFIVYPEAFSTMPAGFSQLFSILFFIMLLCLAIDSQVTIATITLHWLTATELEVVVTAIEDGIGRKTSKYMYRKELLVLLVCGVCFLLGLPYITNGGIYYFKLVDYYSSGLSNMLIALFEAVAIIWCYGALKMVSHTGQMTGGVTSRILRWYLMPCWYVLAPLFITAIMIFNWVQYQPVNYGKYTFPEYAEGIGWEIAGLSIICLPLGMIRGVLTTPGESLCEKIKCSMQPQLEDSSYDVNLQMSTEKENLPPELGSLVSERI